ncbi:hypothetical protein R1sor_027114 [Riccia sorocarpa]|uniref:Uncharacterized protein n=1 Tax=Riccia sorocarpa TaxID=122646 RepID=A0ABD3GEU3_9MARC
MSRYLVRVICGLLLTFLRIITCRTSLGFPVCRRDNYLQGSIRTGIIELKGIFVTPVRKRNRRVPLPAFHVREGAFYRPTSLKDIPSLKAAALSSSSGNGPGEFVPQTFPVAFLVQKIADVCPFELSQPCATANLRAYITDVKIAVVPGLRQEEPRKCSGSEIDVGENRVVEGGSMELFNSD